MKEVRKGNSMDEHGNLTGWRAAVAKACGNRDPIDPAGVDQVVAAHVRHHVEGAYLTCAKSAEPRSVAAGAAYVPPIAVSHGGTSEQAQWQEIAESYRRTANELAERVAKAEAELERIRSGGRSEYICKCGVRVVPHRCQQGTEF